MRRILDTLEHFATGRTIALLAAIFVAFNALVFPAAVETIQSYSGGVGPLDVELSFSPEEAFSRIEAYGPRGRRVYAIVAATLDVVFPVTTSLLFALLTLYFLRRAFPGAVTWRTLALVPFGALFADLAENAGIVALLVSYPARPTGLARVTSVIVSVKWAFVAVSVAIVLLTALAALVRRLRSAHGGSR